MDVGNQRHLDQLLDLAERLGGVHVRYRNADDVDAGSFQTIDLGNGGSHIIGVAVGHALHSDRRIAANRHVTDPDLARNATFDWRFAVHDLLTQLQASSLATGERSDIDRLAVIADLCGAGDTQAYRKWRLAGHRNAVAFMFQTAEQHLAATVGDLGPAIGGELQLHLTIAGSWSSCFCGWRRGGRDDWCGNGRRRSGRNVRCRGRRRGDNRGRGVSRCGWRHRGCGWSSGRSGRLGASRFSGGFRLWQRQCSRALGLAFGNGLVFRLVDRVNLRGAIGAFDFNVLRGQAGHFLGAQRSLILPPDKTAADDRNQQQQTDNAQMV